MVNLVLALISGVIGALVLAIIPKEKKRVEKLIVLLSSILGAIFTWLVALPVLNGRTVELAGEIAGFSWSIGPDPLGAVFGLIASSLWVFAIVYSFGYMEGKKNQKRYYIFLLLASSATLGVAFSGNLIALYLFYELLTLTTYPLVIHDGTEDARESGLRYIMYSLSGAGAILVGIVMVYSMSGNLNFTGNPILSGFTGGQLNLPLALFVIGFGVKAAIMPLHKWLPGAMVAPTPISALLHAVAVVYSGAYGIIRVVYSVFGYSLVGSLALSRIMPWVIGFTILVGVIIARRKDVLKGRLAYQTISHISYILLGAFTLHPWGLAGAIMHMISYSTLKMSFFFCAGIIAQQTGETDISRMGGIGWKLPKTFIAFTVATVGMIGMLPLNTFWGKFYLMKGSIDSGMWPLAVVLVLSGIINGACFIPVIVDAFKGGKGEKNLEKGRSFKWMMVPTLILSVFSIVVGIWPDLVWPGVESVVNSFF